MRSMSSGGASVPSRAISGSAAATGAGIARSGATRSANAARSASDGSDPFEHEVPDVLERPRLREVDGAVLAVVVEALEAADVADVGLGDHDAFEPARDLVREVLGRLDLRDAHEVAHRDDADELVRLDHRDVAVPVLGEARERGDDVDVRPDRVRRGGHPLAHHRGAGVATRRGEAHEVAFGQDADGAELVDRDDRAHAVLAHGGGRLGHLVVGAHGDDGPTHDVGDRARLVRRGFGHRPRSLPPGASVGSGGARTVPRVAVGAINLPRARQRWRVFGRGRSYVLRPACRAGPRRPRSGRRRARPTGSPPVRRRARARARPSIGQRPLVVGRLPVEPHARLREARDLGGERDRGLARRARRDDAVGEPDRQRLLGADRPAR